MPVTVRCSCGKQSDLPESLLGKRVRCNFCGALSIVAEAPAEEHADLDWETHVAESLLSGPGADAAAVADSSSTALMERTALGVPAFDEVPSSADIPAVAAPDEAEAQAETEPMPEPAPRVEGAKQYKVLTQRDKWFGGRFDPERFEDALNFFAGQGWVVRSMTAGSIGGGSREELVVLLERG